MSRELQPPVLSASLVKSEFPTVIKNEPPESEIVEIGMDDMLDSLKSEEEIIPDVKEMDIVCEESIKSEILESKNYEFVETQVLVKAENSPFIQADNKIEDTKNDILTKGTDQEVVDVQGLNEYSNVLNDLEADAQLVLNFSKDLNASTRTRKTKQPEKTNFVETTSREKDKEKIKVIKTPVIPIEAHEYTSLAKDKHICNYCQHACNTLNHLKRHIKKIHREVTMYQCPYCPYKPKRKHDIKRHIIQKHKVTKDIEWFHDISVRNPKPNRPEKTDFAKCYRTPGTTSWEGKRKIIKAPVNPVGPHEYITLAKDTHACNHCQQTSNRLTSIKLHIKKMHREVTTTYQCSCCLYKSKWRSSLRRHIIHKHKDTEDIQGFRYHCNKCTYRTDRSSDLKRHKLIHLKPEEIQYFYCYHCSYKSKHKKCLKNHIFKHFKKVELKREKRRFIKGELKREKRFGCNKCSYKTYLSANLKNHKLTHLKPEEIQYFYCYHCSYKSKRKIDLSAHIFRRHFKNVKQEKRLHCNKCNYKTCTSTNLKSHKLTHLKPEEIHYFYCYHCSYKAKRKGILKIHILKHFKMEQVEFDCYICNFMAPKRESIIKHIRKHSKVRNKSEINEGP